MAVLDSSIVGEASSEASLARDRVSLQHEMFHGATDDTVLTKRGPWGGTTRRAGEPGGASRTRRTSGGTMTREEFRRIALSFAGAEERSHMGHPDFRVGGKIFATLGHPDDRFGTLMLSPEDQAILVRAHPEVFKPAAGAWGRAGTTSVLLRGAPRRTLRMALEAAWERRAPKRRPTKATPNSARRTTALGTKRPSRDA